VHILQALCGPNESSLSKLLRRAGDTPEKGNESVGPVIGLKDIQSAAQVVYANMPPTPQYRWPLLCEQLGADVYVKHENQTPVGAFKIRGGLVYFSHLVRAGKKPAGVISATRGNHGQSVGYAARQHDIPCTVVVPHGNSVEKNAAMRSLGVELVEYGNDFQESLEHALKLADRHSLHFVPSFHPLLIAGVATYSLELFNAVENIHTAYVPIGLGSGICGMIAVRDALGLDTRIVGVVSAHATAYSQSFSSGRLVESPATTLLADGMACRTPQPAALEIIGGGVDRIVEVSDEEVAAAMRMMFECTHNTCEGAGAASLAAAKQEQSITSRRRIAVIASGGNVDREVFAEVLGA
jgi:threonine dehydratase